jgi:hypothetical protein
MIYILFYFCWDTHTLLLIIYIYRAVYILSSRCMHMRVATCLTSQVFLEKKIFLMKKKGHTTFGVGDRHAAHEVERLLHPGDSIIGYHSTSPYRRRADHEKWDVEISQRRRTVRYIFFDKLFIFNILSGSLLSLLIYICSIKLLYKHNFSYDE